MKKIGVIICMLCSCAAFVQANTTYLNNTQTTYNERTYITISKTKINASLNSADKVLDKFIYDLTHDPESLFDNILNGLGSQGEGKDVFVIGYKDYHYDSATSLYTGTLDVYMGDTKLKDIDFTGKIQKTAYTDKRSEAYFELIEINPVVKIAHGKIVVQKIDSHTIEITQTATFKFGFLFNLFFSMKNYKNVAEWRLDQFLENIKKEILLEEEKLISKH